MSPLFRLLVLLILLAGIGTSSAFLTAFSQKSEGQDRLIEMRPFSNAPVKIITVKTKAGEVKVGNKFKDDDDWLKGLTFKVENVSNRPINYISAVVIFPKPGAQGEENIPYGEGIIYGVSPLDPPSSTPKEQVQFLPPGESIELSLNDKSYEASKIFLNRLKYPESINHIELSIQEVGFEDGTVWSGGEFWRRDPNKPGKAIKVPHENSKNSSNGLSPPSQMVDSVSGNFIRKVLWMKPTPVQTSGDCRLMGPEIS
jgi:hypothetical protein